MSTNINNPYNIAGKPVQGGLPINNQRLAFNAVSNQWEFITDPAIFDGAHTSLTDTEVAGIIDHADDSINAAKLRADSVITSKILDLNVTTPKIALLAITPAQLAVNAVETDKILDLNVTTPKIGDLAITDAKIAGLAVTGAKLALLAVTNSKIAAFAVSLTKMKTELGNADLFIGYDGAGVVIAKAAGGGGVTQETEIEVNGVILQLGQWLLM